MKNKKWSYKYSELMGTGQLLNEVGLNICLLPKGYGEKVVKAVNSHEELVRIIDKILAIGALERVERFDVLEDAKAILEKVNK